MKHLFLKFLAQTSHQAQMFEVKYGKGSFLYNYQNKAFFDLVSGVGVCVVGHNNPMVKKAIISQTEKYLHTMVYGEHLQHAQINYSQKIIQNTDYDFDQVYFLNSGAEAVDAAIKIAFRCTGKRKMVALENSYHGSTLASSSLMSDTTFQGTEPRSFEVFFAQANNRDTLALLDNDVAGIIIEPIQAEAGIRKVENDFLKEVKNLCEKNKILLIMDEIQTGFGRTGKFWAYQHSGVQPDILLSAKALGGGLPLAAVIGKKTMMNHLTLNSNLGHLTTFGGHPLSCASGMAALNYIKEENIIAAIKDKEQLFRDCLQHPLIKEIRGQGLMLAIEFESEQIASKVLEWGLKLGYLSDLFLFCQTAIRVSPPLTINKQEITEVSALILHALNRIDIP